MWVSRLFYPLFLCVKFLLTLFFYFLFMTQADFFSIQEGNNKISFNGKILSWEYITKKMFFFSNTHEFTFPIRQISSIRFYNDKVLNMKSIIFWGIWVLLGIATISYYIWIVLIWLWWYMLYQNFKPINWIKIITNWWDNELFFIEQWNNNWKAKELIELVKEKITEIS